MTPEEQARAILGASMRLNEQNTSADAIERGDPGFFLAPAGVALHALIKALSREEQARAEERERCARIAENIAPHFCNPMGDAIAAAIRSAPSSQRGD